MSAYGQRWYKSNEANRTKTKSCEVIQEDPYTKYIDSLFTKQFHLSHSLHCELPDASLCFQSEPWQDPKLEELKNNLNECKNQLNDFAIEEWSCHTSKRNPAGDVSWWLRRVVNPEFLTQAWTKFYECASMYDIIAESVLTENKLVSLHLCEAPGAFITSLNHFLRLRYGDIEWQWRATTLNPYYEGNSPFQMIGDDRFMFHTLAHWTFGEDNTGDIMNIENSESIIQNIQSLGKVMLVTADGSIDCMARPDEQESFTSPLHYCETITALRALHQGGTLIFKLFTMFEHSTVNLLYLLTCVFDDVHICKPLTSKEGNSEVYAVCLRYHGVDKLEAHMPTLVAAFGTQMYTRKSLFPRTEIDTAFLNKVHLCSHFFSTLQCKAIDDNIQTFREPLMTPFCIKQLRQFVAKLFQQHYNIQPIAEEFKILKGEVYKKPISYNNKKCLKGSYTQRTKYGEMDSNDKLQSVQNALRMLILEMNQNKMLISSKMMLELYTNEDLQLHLTIGKPIKVLCSSKFIYTKLLNLFFDIFKVTSGCSEVEVKQPSDTNDVSCHVLSFPQYDHKEIFDLYEKKCFNLLYDKLSRLNINENLILFNMNLLTHFNVSVLNILSKKCFKSIAFMKGHIELESFIEFNKLTDVKIQLDKMHNVNTILSALPVNITDKGDLYESIVLYNNTVYSLRCKVISNCFAANAMSSQAIT